MEQFDQCLAQYADITKLLSGRKEEVKSCELRLAKARGEVEALEKERVRIAGAIDTLKSAGVKELETMTEEATKRLSVLAATDIGEIQTVGREVRSEFSDFRARIDALAAKVFEIGEEFERTRQKLRKYEGVKNILESHAAASEQ